MHIQILIIRNVVKYMFFFVDGNKVSINPATQESS